jgi:flagellar hook-associated protein 2
VSSISSSGLNFSGLASGIDSQKIIDGLTAINGRRVQQLTARKDTITLKQTTFASLQAKVLDFQGQASRLGRSVAGAFDARTVTPSDKDAVQATAGTAAVPGTYAFAVTALAQANSVASDGFADPGSRIKEGTFAFRVGSGAEKSVTVGPTNNTVQGLADAINNAGGDVRATLLNDGSATPYRLVLTATKTGAANAIQVTNGLTAGAGADVNPTATTVQAAADASIQLGSGAGAITVRSATNQFTGLIPGVTVTASKADPAKQLSVVVAGDTAGASKAVQDFVSSFNAVIDFIDERDNYDAATGRTGTLLGSREATELQNDLTAVLTAAVPGLGTAANRLSAVGVTLTDKGRLQVDEGKLTRALSGQEAGVSAGEVKRLFALTGSSSDSGVSFVVGSDKTKPSPAGQPYRVSVTSPATRGNVTAASPPAPTVTIDGSNNHFRVVVNGISSNTLSLAAGTYTPASLAAAVQAVVNSDPPVQGNQVSVDLVSGQLRITSAKYGAASSVEVAAGGTALAALGFLGGERASGTDVAGTFSVNGRTEAATGSGQLLTGGSGNANTDGLQVLVTAAGPATADLGVTQGVASRLGAVLNKYLDPVNGRFETLDNQFAATADGIDKTITRQNQLVEDKTQSLLKQFVAMETAVSKLRNLGTQLASLPVYRSS